MRWISSRCVINEGGVVELVEKSGKNRNSKLIKKKRNDKTSPQPDSFYRNELANCDWMKDYNIHFQHSAMALWFFDHPRFIFVVKSDYVVVVKTGEQIWPLRYGKQLEELKGKTWNWPTFPPFMLLILVWFLSQLSTSIFSARECVAIVPRQIFQCQKWKILETLYRTFGVKRVR